MKYYRNNENEVYAFKSDGSQDAFIPDTLIPISQDEAFALSNPVIVLTPEQLIAAIKAKAGQIILARLPDYKQRNYLARKAELQDILIAGGTLSASEQAEWDFFAAEWAWAKAVRATSDAAEIAGTPVDEIVWPT